MDEEPVAADQHRDDSLAKKLDSDNLRTYLNALCERYEKYLAVDLPQPGKSIATSAQYSAMVNRLITAHVQKPRSERLNSPLRKNLALLREAYVHPRLILALKEMFAFVHQTVKELLEFRSEREDSKELIAAVNEKLERLDIDVRQYCKRIDDIVTLNDSHFSTLAWDAWTSLCNKAHRLAFDYWYPPPQKSQNKEENPNNNKAENKENLNLSPDNSASVFSLTASCDSLRRVKELEKGFGERLSELSIPDEVIPQNVQTD